LTELSSGHVVSKALATMFDRATRAVVCRLQSATVNELPKQTYGVATVLEVICPLIAHASKLAAT
jgi:hypothetical protein